VSLVCVDDVVLSGWWTIFTKKSFGIFYPADSSVKTRLQSIFCDHLSFYSLLFLRVIFLDFHGFYGVQLFGIEVMQFDIWTGSIQFLNCNLSWRKEPWRKGQVAEFGLVYPAIRSRSWCQIGCCSFLSLCTHKTLLLALNFFRCGHSSIQILRIILQLSKFSHFIKFFFLQKSGSLILELKSLRCPGSDWRLVSFLPRNVQFL
jgi:hypothetical protein